MATKTLLWMPLLLAAPLLRGQEPTRPAPFIALEELAAKAAQPSQPGGVPPQARASLERFKDRLGPWFQGRLAVLGGGSRAELGQGLSRELDALAARAPSPEGSFWHPLRFQVEAPEAHPELITVTARFGIDATLLLFRRSEGGWRLLWQDRAPAYADIDGAFGSYQAALTPKNADGSFCLAAARITPWYQSNWRQAELRVFRIGPEGVVRKLGQREEEIFLGDQDPMTLAAPDAQHIVLRVRARSSDLSRHTFSRVFHLRLDASDLQRVPPYAETPLDLVDEWLQLPWAEAEALVDAPAQKRLKPLHARLADLDENVLAFDEAATETTGSGTWELRAELERGDELETYLFRVGKTGEGLLRILDVLREGKP